MPERVRKVKHQVMIFIDGCPKHANMPANNRAFRKKKLTGNKLRDRFVTRELRKQGWRVVRIWEHALTKSPARCIERIKRTLEARSSRE
jgi:DNA mismatch endonuclease (patch repair protein)